MRYRGDGPRVDSSTVAKAYFAALNTARGERADHIDDSPKDTICGRGIVSCDVVVRLLQIVLRER
jgi:hypothetical protein